MADQVPCNRCGARLEVGPQARFVTCDRCGAELAVQRTRSAVFTEAMSESDSAAGEPGAAANLRRDLARLEREWLMERQQYMVMNRYGRRYVPTPAGSLMVAVTVVGFGLVWTVTAFSMADLAGRGDPFRYLGILVIVLGIVVGGISYRRARRYQKAYDEYRRRRQALLIEDEGE
jgi:hypothetical protein